MTSHAVVEKAFTILHPGMLTTVQDLGRYGQSHLGLTTGGPSDKTAFSWANRLLNNDANDAMLEVTFGGLKLKSQVNTLVCITGAKTDVKIAGRAVELWTTHQVKIGDIIEFGFSEQGVKSYFAVKGGLKLKPQFGSVATVTREGIGGIQGKGLEANNYLAAESDHESTHQMHLLEQDAPYYSTELRLRVIPGYQQALFSRMQQRRFFSGHYKVSKQWDRMGYRLEGPAINCEQRSLLSEGIALGAVQIPPDGQPIVLMQDRQTIGGYPKIGSVLSLDLTNLSQCTQGAHVYFEPISMEKAHNELYLAKYRYETTKPVERSW